MEKKQLAPHPPSGAHHRGYSAPGREKVVQYDTTSIDVSREDVVQRRTKAADSKESFESGREDDTDMPNIWLPDGILPGFKEVCLDFFWSFQKIETSIFKALALGLNIPEDFFLPSHASSSNQLRLLHYPSVSITALENEEIALIGQHSDYGSITLLFQDDAGGLEVEDPHHPGSFRPAIPVPGALVVNAGDLLMRWSNDTIRSTVHRVRAPPHLTSTNGMTPERYSIPYFCSPDFDSVIECIPGTWSDERPKQYGPISAGDYLLKRLAASY